MAMDTDQHPLTDIGTALRYLREKRSLVQQDIADRLGINKASVSRLEQPGANPTTNSVGNYLRVIKASAQELIDALNLLAAGSKAEAESEAETVRAETTGTGELTEPTPETPPPSAMEPLEKFRTDVNEKLELPGEHREFADQLITFYRREFVELHERIAMLEARLKDE